jgi:hypothetical protein
MGNQYGGHAMARPYIPSDRFVIQPTSQPESKRDDLIDAPHLRSPLLLSIRLTD